MSKTIGIIGAGQMGSGIAQTVAAHGMQVLLADVGLEVAEKAHAGIDKAPSASWSARARSRLPMPKRR